MNIRHAFCRCLQSLCSFHQAKDLEMNLSTETFFISIRNIEKFCSMNGRSSSIVSGTRLIQGLICSPMMSDQRSFGDKGQENSFDRSPAIYELMKCTTEAGLCRFCFLFMFIHPYFSMFVSVGEILTKKWSKVKQRRLFFLFRFSRYWSK